MSISIFAMNDKFQVKFEAGPMEQTYKLSQEIARTIDDVKNIIDQDFMNKVLLRFNEMYMDLKAAGTKSEQ